MIEHLEYVKATGDLTRLSVKGQALQIRQNGKLLCEFGLCNVYDLLYDGMSTKSRSPGIKRRALQMRKP